MKLLVTLSPSCYQNVSNRDLSNTMDFGHNKLWQVWDKKKPLFDLPNVLSLITTSVVTVGIKRGFQNHKLALLTTLNCFWMVKKKFRFALFK